MSWFVPPPKRPPVVPSAAEVLALRVMVIHLVTIMADESERLRGGNAQSWINRFAASCADVLRDADMSAADGGDVERLRREALDQINYILGDIRFPRDTDKSN
jgi:hypothetical protein